jgi:hypothetical protein
MAGVVSYRVKVEMGEVKSLPDARPAAPKPAVLEQPEFEADWKTRYEWDSGEYADLMALRRGIADRDAQAPASKPKDSPAAKAPAAPGKPDSTSKLQQVKAAGVRPEPAKPPAAAPPAAAKPAAPTPDGAPAAKPAAPSAPKPAPPPAPKPAPAPAPVARTITKVRLVGPGVDLSVATPGTYEIGRLSDVALRIVHPTVSRRQAKITLGADRTSVRLEHTGSSPTLVNNRVLTDSTLLADGDQLQFGEVTLAVKFE